MRLELVNPSTMKIVNWLSDNKRKNRRLWMRGLRTTLQNNPSSNRSTLFKMLFKVIFKEMEVDQMSRRIMKWLDRIKRIKRISQSWWNVNEKRLNILLSIHLHWINMLFANSGKITRMTLALEWTMTEVYFDLQWLDSSDTCILHAARCSKLLRLPLDGKKILLRPVCSS